MSATFRVLSLRWGRQEACQGTGEGSDIQGILDIYLGTQPSESHGPRGLFTLPVKQCQWIRDPQAHGPGFLALEAGGDQCQESGPSVSPSRPWSSEVQVPPVCRLQMLLTPSPLGAP